MKYFALKIVMFVYYGLGLLALVGSTFSGWTIGGRWLYLTQYAYSSNGFSSYEFDARGSMVGLVVGAIAGAIVATMFVAIAQLIQLVLDMKEEQSLQTQIMHLQANSLSRFSGR